MENPRKKLFICITKASWGGAQKYVFDLATSLPKESFDISVLFGEGGLLEKRLKEKGIKTTKLENSQRDPSIKKDIKLIFELVGIFKKEKPDIIHLNSSKIGLLGAIAGRLAGIKKIIFTVHGWAFNEDRPLLQKAVFWIMQVKTVFLCHRTIAVSENTKNQLRPRWLQKKISVIHNGIDDIGFLKKEEAKNKIIESLDDNKKWLLEKKWVGTISELHKNKGLNYAIEAFSKLEKDIMEKFVFIIIGEGEERKNLEAIIKKLGLKENIFLIGKIENASLYLKAFDIFVLTSITEALPYVLLEAGQSEVPIISTDVGGIPEIIEDKKSGLLIRPKNQKEIIGSLEYLSKNYEKAIKTATDLKARIKSDFRIDKMVKETMGAYSK